MMKCIKTDTFIISYIFLLNWLQIISALTLNCFQPPLNEPTIAIITVVITISYYLVVMVLILVFKCFI